MQAHLTAYYLSKDRVLGLFDTERLPAHVLAALQGQDIAMASAILSNAVGSYLLDAIANGSVKTLQHLAFERELRHGAQFIYDGHVCGKGFGYSNKAPALTLSEKLDEPLSGKQLRIEFSKNGLVNDTAYSRMSGSTRLFVFGYIVDVDATTIRVPEALTMPLRNSYAFGSQRHGNSYVPTDSSSIADKADQGGYILGKCGQSLSGYI